MKNVMVSWFTCLFALLLNIAFAQVNPSNSSEIQIQNNFLQVLSPQNVWYTAQSSGWNPNTYYQRWSIDSSKVNIDSQSYQQVLSSVDSSGNQWEGTRKYVREDDGKLWLIDSTENAVEVCIMDMNVKIGDEIFYTDILGKLRKYLVAKIDYVTDKIGQIRKVVHLKCDSNEGIRLRWIEGVGPDLGVFSTYFRHCVIDGDENTLICLFNNGVHFWQRHGLDYCWKPNPPTFEPLISIINANVTRYMVINNPFFPNQKMERWKFNFIPKILNFGKAYYELLISDQQNGNNFTGSGRFFREEDNRFYQYISPSEGELLLYDMNLKAGDSIMMDYADGPVTLVVTKEDSIQLDDEKYRKRLTLQCVRGGELESGNAAEWIEGIGRLYETFVDFSHCSIWDVARPEVYCIFDQNQPLYKSKEAPSDCWVDDFYTTDMDSTATWYSSSYVGDFSSGDCRLKIDITKVVRDTSIQYRKCRIIGVFSDGKYLPESEIITFQNADKLYFYEDNNWKLLYDFAARVGDTVTYFVSKKYPYYAKYSVPGPFEDRIVENNPYQIVIQEVDTILDFSGKPLKRYKTQQISNFQGHFMGEIVENVGSIEKLFGNNVTITPPECNPSEEFPKLRCYSDDDTFFKFVNGECNKIVASNDISEGSVKLFPNPGRHEIQITLTDHLSTPVNIKFSDVAGRLLINQDFNSSILKINTDGLNSGLYIITLKDPNGKTWKSKWVKH